MEFIPAPIWFRERLNPNRSVGLKARNKSTRAMEITHLKNGIRRMAGILLWFKLPGTLNADL